MKRKTLWYVLGGIAALLVIIQLLPIGTAENPPVTAEIQAPPEVMEVFRRSCYDCHSHETVWPWYSHVAPVRWLVRRDVAEAREHFNMSTFEDASARRRAHGMEELAEVMEDGEMPLWFYVPLHPEAAMSDADRELLRTWALEQQARIEAEGGEPAGS